MSKLTATVSVHLERADGSVTTITETVDDSLGGDNPRFEGYESRLLIEHVTSLVLDRLPDSETRPLNGTSLERHARARA